MILTVPLFFRFLTDQSAKNLAFTSSTGISQPVNSLNAATPCHSSMPFPPKVIHPASFASLSILVSTGL